ncbi:MAG: hypothetical protein ABIT37_10330 [Luteolibacter sp.]
MIRLKTLSLPLISALVATTVLPVSAQVSLTLATDKTYRTSKKGTNFRGGTFNVDISDGDGIYVGGCARSAYWPPNVPLDPCPGGSTAYLLFGNIDGAFATGGIRYYWVTSVIPAIIIEPRRPDLVYLAAAPASDLKRPSKGFADGSFALYYNLHTTDVSEYIISRYTNARMYGAKQRDKFEAEIVPGVYHYILPRLHYPNLKAALSTVIYPMAEGLQTINKQKVGFDFTFDDSRSWSKNGFVELSYSKPNIITWKGLTPSNVFAQVDSLYFSMRVMINPNKANSALDLYDDDNFVPQSIFPGFLTGNDPRILMKNPYVTSITLPPIFPSGTRAMVELELDRNFQTGGVSYDYSTRRFQIPVVVVNRYSEYAELSFENLSGSADLLADFDKDGYNNLTEWILDSRAEDNTSVPIPPFAIIHPDVFNNDVTLPNQPRLVRAAYFGFTVDEKLETIPDVVYAVQRSRDFGKTWQVMTSDADWSVRRVRIAAGALPGSQREQAKAQIRVESKRSVIDPLTFISTPVQPPGTASDLYRVKITKK